MSSAPRDEGGRARRRRRRGPASASRTDPNNTNPNRPPRRSPQPHQRGHHQQQPPQALQSQHVGSLSFSASGITTIPQRNVREISRQRQSNPHADTLKNEAKTSQASRATQGRQKAIDEQKRKEEEERKEKEARELKERAEREEREATLARQLEKQHQQRILNLSYRPRKPSQPPEKERPSNAQLRQLDSSLKKCTGFLRKIRSSGINEESLPSLCREAQSLNLSRYISEVVAAISETKLRYADVEHATLLTGELYRRYEDFVTQLVAALGAIILSHSNNALGRDVGSRKAAMRLLVEIFVLGMVADVSPITNVLKQLVRVQKDARDESLSHLSIITTFVRTGGRTMLSHVSKPTSESSSSGDLEEKDEDWRDSVLPQSTKGSITLAFQSYYDAEVNRILTETAEDLEKAYIAVTRSKDVRGDPDEAATATYESARQVYEKVYASARVLADALGKRLPESVLSITQGTSSIVESSAPRDTAQGVAINPVQYVGRNRIVQESDFLLQDESPFDGEEERLFYTMLPILKQKGSNESEDGKSTGVLVNGTVSEPDATDSATSKTVSSGGKKVESRQSPVARNSVEGRQKGSDKPASVEKVLGQLSTVESKESVDAFVSQFADTAESSKNGSKRLAKSLSSVSAQKLNLLPTYSRIAACLYPSFSDIATSVASHLEEEFRYLAGRSDMDEKNLAVCIKNAKYIGEYVKFGLIESSSMFDLLNLCMKDFTGHRVDIACHLLETCGRFLYRTPATHARMGNILETIWRLKSVKNMEARHNALVETAYFASKPTSASKLQKRKNRPPMHEYIRHLIYYRLDATNIKWTQTQLMKLPWNDDLEYYVIKKFVKISRARFSTIPYVSTLISLLQRFKPGLVIGIVDALLEAIRCGMEKNDGRDSQRRIAEIQLLGELHKCGVVDEGLVYNVLYQSITLGHDRSEVAVTHIPSADETSQSECASFSRAGAGSAVPTSTFTNAPDPPGDFFRVRIACVLLESCGRILVASNRRKVEVFWIFFERYTFYKARQAGLGDRLPLHIGHVVGDAFENVLLRDRRYGRDNRMRKENETFVRTRSGQSHTRQYNSSARFCRSSSLSEAIEAVQQVENSISDRVLKCVPVRHIYQNCAPLNGTRPSSDASPNDASRLHSISRTEKQSGLSETDSSDESNNDGPDSDTEGVTSELSENGMLAEREDLFSADDLAEENGLPRNAIEGEGSREEDSEHDEREDVDGEDDDDDDDSSVEVHVERPKTEEEDAFAKELAAFTADAVQTARATSSRITKFDRMAIPMSLMAKKMEEERAARAAAAASLHLNSESDDSDERMGNHSLTKTKRRSPSLSVGFKVLVRKGGKSQLQDLEVPASSSLAVAAKENETADAARHEETKRLVLGSSIVLNHDEEDLDEEVPLRTQQNVRAKEESIRLQRSADEMALLSAVYHHRPNTRR